MCHGCLKAEFVNPERHSCGLKIAEAPLAANSSSPIVTQGAFFFTWFLSGQGRTDAVHRCGFKQKGLLTKEKNKNPKTLTLDRKKHKESTINKPGPRETRTI